MKEFNFTATPDVYLKSPTTPKTAFTNEWFNATADEIRAHLLLCVAQVQKNKIQKYWSPWKVTETPFFRKEILKDVPSSEAVVLELMKPYLCMGCTVAMDNWYSSLDLFQKLVKEKTNALGTVCVNRKSMPKVFKKMNLKKCDARVLYSFQMER
ncbi:hypothetical protein J437_LFUL001030 [Ladona fulva]|uniref:PiggyBac transposable element-derived protein domain-containing protein n=1 Tax=Ladona fulva TaxID=123851 RepID=A0A8K0KE73_LADFU|nr:hypothetical protein J437_LFUL001030 [Ladona fulva]